MSKTVAEVFVEMLQEANVKRVYGLTGDSLNAFTDVVGKTRGMQFVHVRHEEVAAFAAGAEAELTDQLTVCAGSCGPGNLHLINGLYDCHRSRVPVLAIATQIPTSEIGTSYFQETNPKHLFKECSHFCEEVTDPEQMPRMLAMAIRSAIYQRGVAVIVVSGDILFKKTSNEAYPLGIAKHHPQIQPADADLIAAADIINGSDKVTILGGIGCKGAHDQVVSLAAKLHAPIVHALRGKEHLEYENPFDVGMSGLLGFSSGYHALMDAEVLLMLGTDFPYPQFLPKNAQVIQVDLRGEVLGRRVPIKLGLVGDVKSTVEGLLPLLNPKKSSKHLDHAQDNYRKARKGLDELAVGHAGHTPIHPEYVATLLSKHADADAIFTVDVGTPTIWAARYLQMNGKRRLIGSFVHGSMASALPQAIGAKVSHPSRQVISMSGDGGLAMLLGDLLTLNQMDLGVKIVVFNNSSLAFVSIEMKAAGLVDFGTDLKNPNFAELATSIGLTGIRVEDPLLLEAGIEHLLATPGPALLDVVVNPLELSLPPKITMEQAKGFSVYGAKAVFSGHGQDLIDMAKTNVFDR